MHIGRHIVQELVMQFGDPVVERWEVPLRSDELDEVRQHRERGRAHDVSMLIVSDGALAVIRKPGYPDGAFRIPSGGIHPEESFLDGAAREAHEETGLVVTFTDYLLQVHVEFTSENGEERLPWVTHVLQARPSADGSLGATISPKDGAEIEAAKWVNWEELLSSVNQALRGSGLGGLHYRARLHERLGEIMNANRNAKD
jgi:8-oxo-dGTP pyrophosphatase MutT (NUDIX family)